MRVCVRGIFAAVLMASSAIGHAAWHKASSKHFVIYSRDKPAKLRAYAERLERFDKAVRLVRGWDDPPPGDGNRVTIYVVDSVDQVQRLLGAGNDSVYGFYVGRYTGPVAFSPRLADRDGDGLQADSVFFHEYGHHLMFQHFDRPFPNWYVEGFAELVGSPRFNPDGSVSIGLAPKHRAWGLFSGEGLTTRRLLVDQPQRMNQAEQESIYARGWLLTHYYTLEPSRRGQLQKYFDALATGKSMADAAAVGFGDLKLLDKELSRYVTRPRLPAFTVAAAALATGPISIEPLGAGAEAALPWQMRSKRGVNERTAPEVASKLREIAARFPADAFVQVSLAEAEFDAKRYEASLAAADAALKLDPRSIQAIIYKGRALMELAERGDRPKFAEARGLFVAANKIDPEDPEPLYLFYQSFVRAGKRPNANAISALHYAAVLAPSDDGVRISSAVAYLNQKKAADARTQLIPIAFDPHGGDMAAGAREAIALIDSGKSENALKVLLAERPQSTRNVRR